MNDARITPGILMYNVVLATDNKCPGIFSHTCIFDLMSFSNYVSFSAFFYVLWKLSKKV